MTKSLIEGSLLGNYNAIFTYTISKYSSSNITYVADTNI